MPLQVGILEESFDLVAPRGEELVDRFYNHVFTTAPEIKPLFAHADWTRQVQMALGVFVLLRKSLRNLESIVPALRSLGARHANYGARPEHYAIFGEALLSTMAEIAGSAWRPEYTEAWAAAYQVLQDTLLCGATEVVPSRENQSDLASVAA
jgi:hemoglobin-like flavoprotein